MKVNVHVNKTSFLTLLRESVKLWDLFKGKDLSEESGGAKKKTFFDCKELTHIKAFSLRVFLRI